MKCSLNHANEDRKYEVMKGSVCWYTDRMMKISNVLVRGKLQLVGEVQLETLVESLRALDDLYYKSRSDISSVGPV